MASKKNTVIQWAVQQGHPAEDVVANTEKYVAMYEAEMQGKGAKRSARTNRKVASMLFDDSRVHMLRTDLGKTRPAKEIAFAKALETGLDPDKANAFVGEAKDDWKPQSREVISYALKHGAKPNDMGDDETYREWQDAYNRSQRERDYNPRGTAVLITDRRGNQLHFARAESGRGASRIATAVLASKGLSREDVHVYVGDRPQKVGALL